MIDIPEQEKVQIGKIIEFLRKKEFKKNDPSFKVERFIENICSKATYVKLRKEPLKESEIYDSLLKKLNLSYPYDQSTHQTIIKLENTCLNAFICRQSDYPEILRNLSDLYASSHSVYDHLISEALSNRSYSVADLLKIFHFVRFPMNEIVMNKMIDRLVSLPPSALTPEIQKQLCFRTMRNKIDYLFLIIRNEYYYEAVVLCESLFHDATLPEDIAKLKIARLFLLHNIDPQHFDEAADALRQDPLFYLMEQDWIHICAIHACFSHDFKKAEPLFLKEAACKKTFFPAILFLAHMHRAEENFDLSIFHRFEIDSFPVEYQHLYTYFEMKFARSSFEKLEDYLWNVCRKEIKEFYPSNIIAQLIHDELLWISENTGNRARLYAFHQQFE